MSVAYYRGEIEARLGLYPALAFGAVLVFPYTESWLLSAPVWLFLFVLLGADKFFAHAFRKFSIFIVTAVGLLMNTVVSALIINHGDTELIFIGKIVGMFGLAIFIGVCFYVFNVPMMRKLGFELLGGKSEN